MSRNRELAVVNSALWAASGDALGWITELARDGTVQARAGVERVTEPVAWKRLVGGRFGVKIPFPPGTYSNDTQLRLAVCRAIRGNGVFDAEAFARVELTTWQSYALGAGRGTRAAAANLARRGVNWFSNFFETNAQRYPSAGGNGAAMRSQPHVWASGETGGKFILSVLRDALTTHGHPHGFCGAVLHAMALADALNDGEAPGPSRWAEYLRTFSDLPQIILQDRQLAAFWQSAWEQASGQSVEQAIELTRKEAERDLAAIHNTATIGDTSAYQDIITTLGCLDDKFRGSGLKTALAACALAWLYREKPIKEALIAAANALNSDTDTIATMAGALLGACTAEAPNWPIQDRSYIEKEALRLAAIGRGELRDSFAYPDLARWQPPSSQSDAIRLSKTGGLVVIGLGEAEPFGDEYTAGDAIWQWLRLPFDQTILGKRKPLLKTISSSNLLPGERRVARSVDPILAGGRSAGELPLPPPPSTGTFSRDERRDHRAFNNRNSGSSTRSFKRSSSNSDWIDVWTTQVIDSNFDDFLLGNLLNRCIDEYGSVEGAVTFAALLRRRKSQGNAEIAIARRCE
jgi:ADP-ribosylglycohydrolase